MVHLVVHKERCGSRFLPSKLRLVNPPCSTVLWRGDIRDACFRELYLITYAYAWLSNNDVHFFQSSIVLQSSLFLKKPYFSPSMIAIAMMMWGRTIGWLMGVNFIYNLIHWVHTPISTKVCLSQMQRRELIEIYYLCTMICPAWSWNWSNGLAPETSSLTMSSKAFIHFCCSRSRLDSFHCI